jgi:tetratricopeptide (TPR) repeat protein
MGTYGIAPAGDVMPRARRAAEQALAIDPDIAEAWAVIADVEAQYDRDPVRAAASWARALAADPRHSRSRCERSLWLNAHGAMDGEEMVADTARAVADDPLNAWVVGMHSWALAYAGRSDEAVAEAERALTLDPGSFHAHWNLLRALGFAGQFARAIELGRPMLATGGRSTWFLGTLGWLYAKNAQPEHATAIYRELEARSRLEFVMPFWLVITASSAGLSDDAERLARRAVAERDPLTVLARTVPLWDAARALPWFDEVTKGVWG